MALFASAVRLLAVCCGSPCLPHQPALFPSPQVLVGQRYGYVPLPAAVAAVEFERVRDALLAHGSRETRKAPLLDVWYRQDTNALESVYLLQRVDEVDTRPLSRVEVRRPTQLPHAET